MPSGVKFITKQQVSTRCTLTHMTDLMTYPYTTSHISLKSQVFSSLLTTCCDPQRSVSTWSALRPEASAPRRSRPRWMCKGATTKRWLRRLRSDGSMASRNIGRPRGAEAGLCVLFLVFCPTSHELSCVLLVCWSMAVKRSAFVPQRSSTPGFLFSHVARSLVSAIVCRRLASSAAAAASRTTRRRSTDQRSRWCVGTCAGSSFERFLTLPQVKKQHLTLGRQRRFLRAAQKHHTAQRHSAKTRHLTPHLTPWHSPQTLTAPEADKTW